MPILQLHELPSAERVRGAILFDICINSGTTMTDAIPIVKECGWDIFGYWTVVFNDLEKMEKRQISPRNELKSCLLQKSEMGANERFHFVYTGRDLLDYKPDDEELDRRDELEKSQVKEQCKALTAAD